MTARINARLDEELAQKLDELRRRTGRSTTELVRASIAAYYEAERQRQHPGELLAELVGVGDAGTHLSSDYKELLALGLEQKHGKGRRR
jgi:predicted transcriptional regulator